ncbi:MAG: LUD domain-containing protein [Chloroflexi bacterium]|nr:LUD domain-containing protein [Chloroflexota bacterium]
MMNPGREEILGRVRAALGRRADSLVAPIPSSARVPPRQAGDADGEVAMLLGEIAKLGGNTARLTHGELQPALERLVQTEGVKKATLWQTRAMQDLGVMSMLASLGVEIVSPYSDKHELADCELGVTGADGALPETGTLLLCSSPEQPRMVSLLPRVHLAIIRPSGLHADVGPALAGMKGNDYMLFITGPSRTADIELTVTIGVHGPKSLHVWVME